MREDPERCRAEVDAHTEFDGESPAGASLRLSRPSPRSGSDGHKNALACLEVGSAEQERTFLHDAESRRACGRRWSSDRGDEKDESDRASDHRNVLPSKHKRGDIVRSPNRYIGLLTFGRKGVTIPNLVWQALSLPAPDS